MTLAQATALAELIWGSEDGVLVPRGEEGSLYRVMASLMCLEDPDMVEDGWQAALYPVGEAATLDNYAYIWDDTGSGFAWQSSEALQAFAHRYVEEQVARIEAARK